VRVGEDGIEILPYPEDPDPLPLLGNIAAAVADPARIARPMVRRGWLEDGPVALSSPAALDLAAAELRRVDPAYGPRAVFGGSYGWASAGRFHDTQRDPPFPEPGRRPSPLGGRNGRRVLKLFTGLWRRGSARGGPRRVGVCGSRHRRDRLRCGQMRKNLARPRARSYSYM
jgi:hypothetical protein